MTPTRLQWDERSRTMGFVFEDIGLKSPLFCEFMSQYPVIPGMVSGKLEFDPSRRGPDQLAFSNVKQMAIREELVLEP